MGDRDGHVLGAQLHRVGDGEVRVAVRVGYQPDAQELLGEVLGDETGRADPVDVDAAGGGEGGDGRAELDGVEPGRGVGEGLLLVVGELGDDVGDRVVDRYVGGDRGGAARLLLGGEAREREAQVAVAGVAQEAGGAYDRRLAGAGELGEAGDREGRAAGRVRGDGLGDPLHGAGHRRRQGPHLGREGGGSGRGLTGENFLHFLSHL